MTELSSLLESKTQICFQYLSAKIERDVVSAILDDRRHDLRHSRAFSKRHRELENQIDLLTDEMKKVNDSLKAEALSDEEKAILDKSPFPRLHGYSPDDSDQLTTALANPPEPNEHLKRTAVLHAALFNQGTNK